MAPLLNADDDFVLTISDDDSYVPVLDEDLEGGAQVPTKPAKNEKKRKLVDNEDSGDKRKKSKKSNQTRVGRDKAAIVETGSSIEDDGAWASIDKDDGVIDSDFEFQIGHTDTEVIEDFDGWATNGGTNNMIAQGGKKGVDIDKLIARKRDGQNGLGAEMEYINHTETSGDILQDDDGGDGESSEANVDGEEVGELHEGDDKGEEDEHEELLAPDGFGMGATGSDEEIDDASLLEDDNQLDEDSHSDDESAASPVPHPEDQVSDVSSIDENDDPTERARREAFFAPEEKTPKSASKNGLPLNSFQNMSLSRPILRGLASVGFSEPTPIQAKSIPVALLGKDVVGGAVTGSGKTAAFMIPILERLLYRPKKVPTSRVAILMPTRELAVQCFNVAKKLASFTDITFCQLVGGFSLREQENVLRGRPDVIIATPGRFIDHMRNSASFTVDTLEILVLDEADRMLEDGFADELNEILTTIPRSRQTMLFSATMTDSVDKLIRVGLNRPVRLLVDARKQTVGTLVQEFVRLRPGREDKRLSYLMHLCSTVYTDRVIIFFRQKREAHRVRIIFGLCGFRVAELHGSMSQEQRISSIESFRSAAVTHLLATDVASRGLDIKGVEIVINYEAPQSHEIYLHRVGRTARAGRSGRSCTIAAEPDRKVVKAAVKSGKAQGAKIVSRAVDSTLIDEWTKRILDMEKEVGEVMQEEQEEKQLGQVEMQVRKGENIIEHEKEILSRPKRTWFESEKERRIAKKTGRAELNGLESVARKKGKRKLSGKDKKRLDDSRERLEGKVWKKGKAERSSSGGLGAGQKGKGGGKLMKKGKR